MPDDPSTLPCILLVRGDAFVPAITLAGHKVARRRTSCCYVAGVKLADRVVQCRRLPGTLNGAVDCAADVARCPLRFVLSDDLTRLCAELAYSKGARSLACADLLHVPARSLWVEWCNQPWQNVLERCGFPGMKEPSDDGGGRRGVLVRSSSDGRRGTLRTFWTVGTGLAVLASSMEAYFDFDTPDDEEPELPDAERGAGFRVYDGACQRGDVLGRCFRFRYERSWSDYYANAALSPLQKEALKRHVLGTIAIDIPPLLTFLLLLASRSSLPRCAQSCERLNRSRRRSGKVPLLDHIEVRAPLLPESLAYSRSEQHNARRSPRLHHVRGHLVRHGSQLFWRVPHLRGSARWGAIRARTVTWTFDGARAASLAQLS
jgi:hypothetical protein